MKDYDIVIIGGGPAGLAAEQSFVVDLVEAVAGGSREEIRVLRHFEPRSAVGADIAQVSARHGHKVARRPSRAPRP